MEARALQRVGLGPLEIAFGCLHPRL
eukprot:COSAG06_NODE_15091_length_1098_cov_1.298298_3_plen_25_part_01